MMISMQIVIVSPTLISTTALAAKSMEIVGRATGYIQHIALIKYSIREVLESSKVIVNACEYLCFKLLIEK